MCIGNNPDDLFRMRQRIVSDGTMLKRPLKKQSSNKHGCGGKDDQIPNIVRDCGKTGVLQEQTLQSVNDIGKWIDLSDNLHPTWKGLLRVDSSAREKQQSVQHS